MLGASVQYTSCVITMIVYQSIESLTIVLTSRANTFRNPLEHANTQAVSMLDEHVQVVPARGKPHTDIQVSICLFCKVINISS